MRGGAAGSRRGTPLGDDSALSACCARCTAVAGCVRDALRALRVLGAQSRLLAAHVACRVKKAEKERLKGIEELEKKEKKEKKKKEKEEKK